MAEKDKEEQKERSGIISFNGGMNKDVHPSLLQEGQYIDAENMSLWQDGNLMSFSSERSPVGLIDGIKILGWCNVVESIVVFCKKQYGDEWKDEIGLIDQTDRYTTITDRSDLNFNESYKIDCTSRVNRGHRLVYFTDGYNPPRRINIDELDDDLNLFLYGSQLQVKFDKILEGSGQLYCGRYFFAARFVTEDGTSDIISDFSDGVDIVDEALGSIPKYIDGNDNSKQTFNAIRVSVAIGTASGRWVEFIVAWQDAFATKFNVFSRQLAIDNTTVYAVLDNLTFTDLTALTIDNVINIPTRYSLAKHLIQKDNRLFLSNLHAEDSIDYTKFAREIVITYGVERIDYPKLKRSSVAKKGYRRGEVYSFAFIPVFNDNSIGYAYHIPYNSDLAGIELDTAIDPFSEERLLSGYTSEDTDYYLDNLLTNGQYTGDTHIQHWKFPDITQEYIFDPINIPQQSPSYYQQVIDGRYDATNLWMYTMYINVHVERAYKKYPELVAKLKGYIIARQLRNTANNKSIYGQGIYKPMQEYEFYNGSTDATITTLHVSPLFGNTVIMNFRNVPDGILPDYDERLWDAGYSSDILPDSYESGAFCAFGDSYGARNYPYLCMVSPDIDIPLGQGVSPNPSAFTFVPKLLYRGGWGVTKSVISEAFHDQTGHVGYDYLVGTYTGEIRPLSDLQYTVYPINLTYLTTLLPDTVSDIDSQEDLNEVTVYAKSFRSGDYAITSCQSDPITLWQSELDVQNYYNYILPLSEGINYRCTYFDGTQVNTIESVYLQRISNPFALRFNHPGANIDLHVPSTNLRLFIGPLEECDPIDQNLIGTVLGNMEIINVNQYGRLENAEYTHLSYTETTKITKLYGGDTYIGEYTYRNSSGIPVIWVYKDGTKVKVKSASVVDKNAAHRLVSIESLIVESDINLMLRHDIPESPNTFYYPKRSLLSVYEIRSVDTDTHYDAYKYNFQYSREKDFRIYSPRPIILPIVTEFPNRTIYSNVSNQDEAQDRFRTFEALAFQDIDSSKGEITGQFIYNDKLFLLVDKSCFQTFTNPVQTQSSEVQDIILGSAGIFSFPAKEMYTMEGGYTGCKDKWSIVPTLTGVIWYDRLQHKFFQIGVQQSSFGKSEIITDISIGAIYNDLEPIRNEILEPVIAVWDSKSMRYIVTINNTTYSVSTFINKWVSRHTYKLNAGIYKGIDTYIEEDGVIKKLNTGDFGYHSITFSLNKSFPASSVFDNLVVIGEFDKFYDTISCKSSIYNEVFVPLQSNLIDPMYSNYRYINNQYQVSIPRNEYGERFKDKYLVVKFSGDGRAVVQMIVPKMRLNYR